MSDRSTRYGGFNPSTGEATRRRGRAAPKATEAQADSAMNADLAKATTRWNRGTSPNGPKPIAGTGVVNSIVAKIKGEPNPENTPEWKARQKKIEDRQLRNTGARIRKKMTGGA